MHYDSIGALSRRIQEQAVSPVDVVDACLKRIDALNPKLNAYELAAKLASMHPIA